MTSWFERGRPALFEALTRVCQDIDRELLEELQQKGKEGEIDGSFENPVGDVSPGISFNSDCEPAESPPAPPATTPGGREDVEELGPLVSPHPVPRSDQKHPASSTDERDWKAEYSKLSARFSALSDNFKKAKEALQKRKDERDRWVQHAKVLEKKIKTAEEKHGIQIIDRDSLKFRSSAQQPKTREVQDSREKGQDRKKPTESTAKDTSHEPAMLPGIPDDVSIGRTEPVTTETGATDDAAEQLLPLLQENDEPTQTKIKQEPSSEGAVFVSERPVKRRRYGDGTTAPVTPVVKVEPNVSSSSPLVSLHRYDFNPHESPDLGEAVADLMTPRKRKADQEDSYHSEPESEASRTRGPVRTNKTPRNLVGRGSDQQQQQTRATSVLTPIDPNRGMIPSSTAPELSEKPLSKGLGRRIADLAEDGRTYENNPIRTPIAPATARPATRGRLNVLLNSPSEEERPLSRSVPRARDRTNFLQNELSVPQPRDLPFERGSRPFAKRSELRTPTVTRSLREPQDSTVKERVGPENSARPSGNSRRNMAPSKLRLDDFKVNPRANDGHEFAFSEVVRDRDERACLPGCVDMHCCGKTFRALALSQRPDPPLTVAQKQEEQKLLEEYLGDSCHVLANMPASERAELWVEAKMRQLANKYGRHKQRYSRMRSPPGFWNADFPSTQELESEKNEAARREDRLVQERYREAMRPGGRWVFRDE